MSLPKKVHDQLKRCERLKKEHVNALKKLEEQQAIVDKKEDELAKANAEYVSLLLTEYDVPLSELPHLLNDKTSSSSSTSHKTLTDAETSHY